MTLAQYTNLVHNQFGEFASATTLGSLRGGFYWRSCRRRSLSRRPPARELFMPTRGSGAARNTCREETEWDNSSGPARARSTGERGAHILGLDLDVFAATFVKVSDTPFLVIQALAASGQAWVELLGVPARRCYISDNKLVERAQAANVTGSAIAAALIPNPGAVMSGDFGEILTAFYLAAQARPAVVIDPARWRYKADRRKAAPGSDVVQMVLPQWPASSAEDRIVCAEAKAKATRGGFDPIEMALRGSTTDRGGRLVNTLEWLKDKALTDGSDLVEIAQLNRFIRAIDHPKASWEFCAVAIIDSSLVSDEIAKGAAPTDECALIVISVPELKERYTELFDAIVAGADQLLVAPRSEAASSGIAGPLAPALGSS